MSGSQNMRVRAAPLPIARKAILMLVIRTLSCGCLQEFVVRAHVPANDSAKYSIAKFPAVRPRANAPASHIAGDLLAAVTAGGLALRAQGPPGFKSGREAAWQLAHEVTQGVRAASGADGRAAPSGTRSPTYLPGCTAPFASVALLQPAWPRLRGRAVRTCRCRAPAR